MNSSHCLEHMRDIPAAFSEWWALVKPGGFMVTVVPHEDLYEQKIWPSFTCGEGHRASFRLQTKESWSPVSFDIYDLARNLPNSSIVSAEIQDLNYDYGLLGKRLGRGSRKIYKWRYSKTKAKRFISELVFQFLRDNFWVKSNKKSGKPYIYLIGKTKKILSQKFKGKKSKVSLSLSDEKKFAVAFVTISL